MTKTIKQPNQIINITQTALNYLLSLEKININGSYLRISVQQGGCAGMSYAMSFEIKENIKKTDVLLDYEKFQIICDNKSLLYLYGMSLHYKDALIDGGFQFTNPNAKQTCGCGKSFTI